MLKLNSISVEKLKEVLEAIRYLCQELNSMKWSFNGEINYNITDPSILSVLTPITNSLLSMPKIYTHHHGITECMLCYRQVLDTISMLDNIEKKKKKNEDIELNFCCCLEMYNDSDLKMINSYLGKRNNNTYDWDQDEVTIHLYQAKYFYGISPTYLCDAILQYNENSETFEPEKYWKKHHNKNDTTVSKSYHNYSEDILRGLCKCMNLLCTWLLNHNKLPEAMSNWVFDPWYPDDQFIQELSEEWNNNIPTTFDLSVLISIPTVRIDLYKALNMLMVVTEEDSDTDEITTAATTTTTTTETTIKAYNSCKLYWRRIEEAIERKQVERVSQGKERNLEEHLQLILRSDRVDKHLFRHGEDIDYDFISVNQKWHADEITVYYYETEYFYGKEVAELRLLVLQHLNSNEEIQYKLPWKTITVEESQVKSVLQHEPQFVSQQLPVPQPVVQQPSLLLNTVVTTTGKKILELNLQEQVQMLLMRVEELERRLLINSETSVVVATKKTSPPPPPLITKTTNIEEKKKTVFSDDEINNLNKLIRINQYKDPDYKRIINNKLSYLQKLLKNGKTSDRNGSYEDQITQLQKYKVKL